MEAELSVTRMAYSSITGISDLDTFGPFCLTSIQITQNIRIVVHLNACSSISGTLLCSNWTLVMPTTWEKTNKNAPRIPFTLPVQVLCCVPCSGSWAWDILSNFRRLEDSLIPDIANIVCVLCWSKTTANAQPGSGMSVAWVDWSILATRHNEILQSEDERWNVSLYFNLLLMFLLHTQDDTFQSNLCVEPWNTYCGQRK